MRWKLTLLCALALATLATLAGCISGLRTDKRYSCGDHSECASNQMCNGVEATATETPEGEPCEGDGVVFTRRAGNTCYYPYCTPENEIHCGEGVCEDGLCVVVEDGQPDSILKCMPWSYAEEDTKFLCDEIWAPCDDPLRTCVYVFDFVASGAEPDWQHICVVRDELVEPI